MAKIVEFDGKKIGVNTPFKLIDTGNNIKKMVKYYTKITESANKADDNLQSIVDQSPVLADIVAEAVCDLLELNGTQKKPVLALNYSFSDEYEFFNECLVKFLGLKMPSLDDEEDSEDKEPEDPKLQDAD